MLYPLELRAHWRKHWKTKVVDSSPLSPPISHPNLFIASVTRESNCNKALGHETGVPKFSERQYPPH